ncbi:MAG TPA: phage holin family protein [Candidatus Polarisedimenticolia bacterium]|nr:phage holin family protein [Candidatus Polarisedimenticolia bacterium]
MTDTEQPLPTLGRLTRRILATFIGALENRAELFAVEFEEENDRILKLVMFGVGGCFLTMMGILLITAVIIFVVPEPDRIWAALGFAIFYLAGAVAAGLAVKKLIKHIPFSESLNQIKKDAQALDAFK